MDFVGEEVVVGAADAGGDEFDEETGWWDGGDGNFFPDLIGECKLSRHEVGTYSF